MQTGKAVYILITNIGKDGEPVTSVERKIQLVTIKSIAMSNLRDDWVVSFFTMKVNARPTKRLGFQPQLYI